MSVKISKMIVLLAFGACQFYGLVSADTTSTSGVVTWEEVKELKDNSTVLLIDVREPNELEETGTIPGSINIPLNTLENTLRNVSEEEFLQKYQREKPKFDSIIVFTCRSGRRSGLAQDIALNLGYINAKNYAGGWLEWESRLNEL